MLPDDNRHGTYAGWQTHYRTKTMPICEPCRQARCRYQRDKAADILAGRPRRIPSDEVRNHLRALLDSGMTMSRIAELSGVHRHTVEMQATGVRSRVSSDHAEWLLGVRPDPDRHGLTSVIPSARRLHALARLGWTSEDVARAARKNGHDIKASSMKAVRSMKREKVRTRTAQAIEAAYESLSMSIAPRRRGPSSFRATAVKKGWAPPLAWDNIDDLNEIPNAAPTAPVRLDADQAVVARIINGDWKHPANIPERAHVIVHWMTLTGISQHEIELRTGWHVNRDLRTHWDHIEAAARQLGVTLEAIDRARERVA